MRALSGPAPEVAAIRSAVRAALADLPGGSLVVAACSGGPDSTALAAGLAFTALRLGLRAGALTVDHGLQDGSPARAGELAERLAALGLAPVEVLTVADAAATGGGPGPEGAARAARYRALDEAADRLGVAAVLLGHTLDDQAETVLLGLARGSGTRSLAGMAARRGRYRRPLLAVRRETTVAACATAGLAVWADPHNGDDRFTRVRVRRRVLPLLEAELGPGVAAALARTAALARHDADALDELAAALALTAADSVGLRCAPLLAVPAALRRRVLRSAALAAGCPASDLRAGHVDALEALVTDWHGQLGVDLPGGIRARRTDGRIVMACMPPGDT